MGSGSSLKKELDNVFILRVLCFPERESLNVTDNIQLRCTGAAFRRRFPQSLSVLIVAIAISRKTIEGGRL